MRQHRRLILAAGLSTFALAVGLSGASPVAASAPGAVAGAAVATCSSGAHTLAPVGSAVYPETGNGGYTSVHTGVFLRYDAPSNRFLLGTRVTLFDQATQCLNDFSVDLERHAPGTLHGGPHLRVDSVTVNGQPASYEFVQPTYPGDPHGADDPDPRAHQASQTNPVGGPDDNPLPPACSPSLANGSAALRHSQDGDPCPANKLVIHPAQPIPSGSRFTVKVMYHGKPGLHHDADGNREGWFRTEGGSSMVTEPIGTEAWAPLNNHPTAKPTYDFHFTTNTGKTAIANGQLISTRSHPASVQFPHGSTTWHWHAAMHIGGYLSLSMVGDYSLTHRVGADGRTYYIAQDQHISASQRRVNLQVMKTHEDITAFEEHYSGAFPFGSDGVVAVIHGIAGDTEEMQSMIVFTRGKVYPGTLYHETMHQWWGDNVSESSYENTFFKEGLATLSQFLWHARTASEAAGGVTTVAGRRVFDQGLVAQFNTLYGRGGSFWTVAPSKPKTYTLFSGSSTYNRPGATYVALRAILGGARFIQTLKYLQHVYGGSSITEPQLESAFHRFMPVQSMPCSDRLDSFFRQWFDTAYPPGGGVHRPSITGPGLAGRGFYYGACHL